MVRTPRAAKPIEETSPSRRDHSPCFKKGVLITYVKPPAIPGFDDAAKTPDSLLYVILVVTTALRWQLLAHWESILLRHRYLLDVS